MKTTSSSTSTYAERTEALAARLARIADDREASAVARGTRLCRDRVLSPAQIEDALTPYSARIGRLRRAAATAARSAQEMP